MGRGIRGVVTVLLATVAAGCDDPTGPGDGAARWTSLAAGTSHACVSGPEDAACWGSNMDGEAGGGSVETLVRPTLNPGGFAGSVMSAGTNYTCGLPGGGLAWCRGQGTLGQLGWGLPASSEGAVPVEGTGWAGLDAGRTHACGVQGTGVWCWGMSRYGYSFGVRPDPRARCTGTGGLDFACVLPPSLVEGTQRFRGVSAGSHHVCAIDRANVVHCWGENDNGQLGTDDVDDCFVADPIHGDFTVPCLETPTPVDLPGPVVGVDASTGHTCALLEDGSVWCWGATAPVGYFGQLGHGGTTGSSEPVRVDAPVSFTRLSVNTTSCALTDEGEAWCWGASRLGAVGTTTGLDRCDAAGGIDCALAPLRVDTAERFDLIATGSEFACGVTRAGSILCWGRNDQGQLGDGTTVDRAVPAPTLEATAGSR